MRVAGSRKLLLMPGQQEAFPVHARGGGQPEVAHVCSVGGGDAVGAESRG